MHRRVVLSPLALLAVALSASCGASHPANFDTGDSGAPSEAGTLCGTDCDHDGYAAPADCNDLDPKVNPEAYDFVGDQVDNDCDGTVDDPVVNCETVPASSPGAPSDFARAGDLCAQRSKTNAGTVFDPLVRAAWGQVSGSGGEQVWTSTTKPTQVNIVSAFGQNVPRSGKTMFGLANGPWGAGDPRSSAALDPAGFHLDDACADIPLVGLDCEALTDNSPMGAVSVQDWAELTLWVKVPSNAESMHLAFAFFSSEFNQWWSSSANDAFFVLVSSKTIAGTNVAKDAHGLAITVNSDFFQLCPVAPGPANLQEPTALQQCVGTSGDAAVAGSLLSTGYDGAAVGTNDTAPAVNGDEYIYGGGSGWLTTSFGVTPSEELELRIVVMDTFDGLKDSAVLVDQIGWDPNPPAGLTRPPQ